MIPLPEFSAIGHLVLARLLAGGDKGVTRAQLKKDLDPLVRHRWEGAAWDERLDQTLEQLESAGLVGRSTKGKAAWFAATPSGRQHGLHFLGVDGLPPKVTWAALKKTYLLARSLDLPAPTGDGLKGFTKDTGFKAALLKAHFGLPTDDYPTLPQAIEALSWKFLGHPSTQKFTVPNVQAALFNRELGDHRQADPKKAIEKILAKIVNARRDTAGELREAVLRSWIDRTSAEPSPPPPVAEADGPPAPLDLDAFARRVLEAARSSPTGWFGDNKVFIADVWRHLQDDPDFRREGLDAFKQRLAEANHARLLDLSRADLVEAMDPEDVAASEATHLGATFHFVRLPERSA
jgi:hypothetical protein